MFESFKVIQLQISVFAVSAHKLSIDENIVCQDKDEITTVRKSIRPFFCDDLVGFNEAYLHEAILTLHTHT